MQVTDEEGVSWKAPRCTGRLIKFGLYMSSSCLPDNPPFFPFYFTPKTLRCKLIISGNSMPGMCLLFSLGYRQFPGLLEIGSEDFKDFLIYYLFNNA
jgi:hypothetical protein